MKLGLEDKKKTTQLAFVGLGALVAAYFLYGELFGGPVQPPPAPPVILTRGPVVAAGPVGRAAVTAPPVAAVAGTATRVGSTSQQLDPTLRMEPMLRAEALVYNGAGRNIFGSAPSPPPAPKLVKANFPARPVVPVSIPPVPTGPPPPPPIALKFFGTATLADGTRQAFLLNGDDVYLAQAGDVVQRRYRIVTIGPMSITVEDIPNANKQALPLVVN